MLPTPFILITPPLGVILACLSLKRQTGIFFTQYHLAIKITAQFLRGYEWGIIPAILPHILPGKAPGFAFRWRLLGRRSDSARVRG